MEQENGFEFWKRVDELRARSRYTTMKDLAEDSGLDYVHVKNQRSDNRLPKIEDACKLSKALYTSVEFLVTGEDPATLPDHIRDIVNRLLIADDVDLALVRRALKMEDIDDNKHQTSVESS
jgi:transcriptional regulator with XRE-family HTH domain